MVDGEDVAAPADARALSLVLTYTNQPYDDGCHGLAADPRGGLDPNRAQSAGQARSDSWRDRQAALAAGAGVGRDRRLARNLRVDGEARMVDGEGMASTLQPRAAEP